MTEPTRCPNTYANGQRCTLDKGHKGKHIMAAPR